MVATPLYESAQLSLRQSLGVTNKVSSLRSDFIMGRLTDNTETQYVNSQAEMSGIDLQKSQRVAKTSQQQQLQFPYTTTSTTAFLTMGG